MIAGRDALSRYLKRTAAAAQQGRLATRKLDSWTGGRLGTFVGTPGYGKTKSDVQFVAFHPQLGRFVTNHLELYGEGTLFLYSQPETAVGGGAAAIGGGVVARILTGPHDANRQDSHLPMRYDTGRPSAGHAAPPAAGIHATTPRRAVSTRVNGIGNDDAAILTAVSEQGLF